MRAPPLWATQAETTRANFDTRYHHHTYIALRTWLNKPPMGKRPVPPITFSPTKVEWNPLDGDGESFIYGSRRVKKGKGKGASLSMQRCRTERLGWLAARLARSCSSGLLCTECCSAIHILAAFHLNSHGNVRSRQAKLSLTNQCLPWHPKEPHEGCPLLPA
jgi:hypothetical protein